MRRIVAVIAVLASLATVLAGTASAREGNSERPATPASDLAKTEVGTGRTLVSSTHDQQTVALKAAAAASQAREATPEGARIRDVVAKVDIRIETADTGFAVLAEFESPSDPSDLRFETSIPEGAMLALTEDGEIDVIGSDGVTIGTFGTPWAIDAQGAPVETSYSLDGTTIVQTVAHGEEFAYPVVADPKFTWGWVTGTLYFNKFETQLICAYGAVAFTWLGIAGFWLGIVTVTVGAYITGSACTAAALDWCIKVKSYGVIQFYNDGYCT